MRNYNFLIITSSAIEYSHILSTFPERKSLNSFQCVVYTGSGKGMIARTQAGMLFFSYSLMKLLSGFSFKLAVNAGICGSFNSALIPGMVVRVKSDVPGDMGTEDGLDLFEMGLVPDTHPPFCQGILCENPGDFSKIFPKLPEAKAVTVNRVTCTPETRTSLMEKYHADVESMEGAAFFYICNLENIPCFQFRAVSNMVGDRNKKNWNFQDSLGNLSQMLRKALD